MYRIHVGNLPWRLSDEQLRKLFGTYGSGEAGPRRIQVSAPERGRPTESSRQPALAPTPFS
jgi:RNA recognition motif-containing protein